MGAATTLHIFEHNSIQYFDKNRCARLNYVCLKLVSIIFVYIQDTFGNRSK